MGKKAVTVPASEVDEFSLNVDLTDGTSVKVEVTYPKDHGLSAVRALATFSGNNGIAGLLHALKHDPSVQKYMQEQGIGFDDDEDDDY